MVVFQCGILRNYDLTVNCLNFKTLIPRLRDVDACPFWFLHLTKQTVPLKVIEKSWGSVETQGTQKKNERGPTRLPENNEQITVGENQVFMYVI